MDYVKFGNTGMEVSRICLGMMSFGKPGAENGLFPWALDYEAGKPLFHRALELGINYFDTANVYQMGSSEENTGRYIREFGLNRDEIVVATKVNFAMRPGRPNGGGLSRKNILAEIDHSLERLGLDYVDVYQIHRLDPNTPMEETQEALHDVVKSGKARYLGASTIFAWQLERLQSSWTLREPERLWEDQSQQLDMLLQRLQASAKQALEIRQHRWEVVSSKLEALSPYAVLQRGYSLTETDKGQVIRSISQVEPGSRLVTHVADGTVVSTAQEIQEKKEGQ